MSTSIADDRLRYAIARPPTSPPPPGIVEVTAEPHGEKGRERRTYLQHNTANMVSPEEQKTINELQANWIWTPNWVDSSNTNTAGRIVHFTREVNLSFCPSRAVLHFSADTRYKLYVNGARIAVGPSRGSRLIWYYDTLDIAPYLINGRNEVRFVVVRYFAASRGAMPFERTSTPGLTVVGCVETDSQTVDLSSRHGWQAQVDESIRFPTGLVDDVFLHVGLASLIGFWDIIVLTATG